MKNTKKILSKLMQIILNKIIENNKLRQIILKCVDIYSYKNIVKNSSECTKKIRIEQHKIFNNLLLFIDKALSNKNVSISVRKKLLDVFIKTVILNNEFNPNSKFKKEVPSFITISPTKKCNLKCTGCYAASSKEESMNIHLDYNVFSKIMQEKRDLWDSHFTVISGGEPFLWKSKNKTILDIFKEYNDNYFLVYTNGTLITDEIAHKLSELGNVTPAISVEGFEEQTDERRGKGVFKKILKTMERLRNNGVPFGISVTATRNNAELLLSDEFIDYFFNKQGVSYGWIFQYMPIGRVPVLDLLITPEQRKWMFEREQYLIHNKNLFYIDFWNGGMYSRGCIAGGRKDGGYMYIEWNGNVTPCVFFPYSETNINTIYKNGGSLNDVLCTDLFKKIRKWQFEYGFEKHGKEINNWITPCPIRDHHKFAHNIIKETGAIPIDEQAKQAINDPIYLEKMNEYNENVSNITKEIWENYLNK